MLANSHKLDKLKTMTSITSSIQLNPYGSTYLP